MKSKKVIMTHRVYRSISGATFCHFIKKQNKRRRRTAVAQRRHRRRLLCSEKHVHRIYNAANNFAGVIISPAPQINWHERSKQKWWHTLIRGQNQTAAAALREE